MRKSRKYIMAVAGAALFAIALLAICIGIICQRERGTPLETFSGYLEKLCREGHRSQLEQYVISRRLSLDEAAALAESIPHMAGDAPPIPNIAAVGICVLAADVNGDGLEDVIEYAPAQDDDGANMLAIYLQGKEGDYRLSCSQPLLDTNIQWHAIIEVVKYKKNIYLLFIPRNEQSRIIACRLSEGVPREKMELTYVCRDVKAETIFCLEGYDVERVLNRSVDYYHTADYYHCAYDARRRWRPMECGSGETEIDREEWGNIKGLFNNKYREERQPYLQKYGDTLINITAWGFTDVFESDMNNNGVREQYIKTLERLGFEENVGLFTGLPIITGEYYGSHEGRRGLWYCIEESGEEMDFLDMCGLDIWEGEMTPQFFWVEETDQGNITCIIYQDGEEFKQRVDGYFIQDKSYEKVFSVLYTPEISCRTTFYP